MRRPDEGRLGLPASREQSLAEFAERVDRLTVAELAELCDAWAADDEQARHSAWLEVQSLAAATGRTDQLRDLQDGLVRWAGVPGRSGLMPLSVLVPSLREEAAQRRASLAPLADTGAALLLGDRLSEEAIATLMRPWNVLTRADDAGD